jgi:hypothetical protein
MREKIGYGYYRYAPETVKCYLNGKQIELTSEEESYITTHICDRKETIDKIKQIIRKRRNQKREVTFGFYKANKSDEYMYTRQLSAYDDDLQDKLRIYKEWKEYCLSRDCDLSVATVTAGTFDGKKMSEGKTHESHDIVDITRPVKLRYKYREDVI